MSKRESEGNNVSTDPKNNKKRIIIILLAAVAVVAAAIVTYSVFNKAIKANTMRLLRIVGTVELRADGQLKTIVDNMRLASGNVLSTGDESLASISLDETKIITIEEDSEAEFYKSGKKLELNLTKGKLFFDVRKALDENESLDIKSSTMVVGIRGTSGYVWTDPVTGEECIFIADGHVEVTSTDDEQGADGEAIPKKVEVKPGEILVTKVTEVDGVKKVDMQVRPAKVEDIPPAVLHELATHEETFERFMEESGYDREEVMKVIEETKEDNYLAVSLVEIDSKGTVVDVPSAPAGAGSEPKEEEKEKKTLSLVIKEIAGKILGNAEAKDGDPNLPGEGDKVTPEVTLIVEDNLPAVSVTKPGTTGTVSNTNPSVTNAVTPMPTSPANPLVANLDETKIPVPPVGPQVGAELPATPEPVSGVSPENEISSGTSSDDDDSDSDDSGSGDSNSDPEPQAEPTPTPQAMPCTLTTTETFVAVGASQNIHMSVLTDSAVQNISIDRSGDNLIFAADSFSYKSELTLASGSTTIGTYHIDSGSSFSVPMNALGSSTAISVRSGAYLPATLTSSASKTVYYDGTQAVLKIRSGSSVSSMTVDRDEDNVYIYGDGLNSGVALLKYSSGSYVGLCDYNESAGKFVISLDELREYEDVSLMALTPNMFPVTISNTQKLVRMRSEYMLINTESSSFEIKLDNEMERPAYYRVESDSFVPGSKLKITSGGSEVHTYTIEHNCDFFALPYEDIEGCLNLTFTLIKPAAKDLPVMIGSEGALVKLSSSRQVFFYASAGWPDNAQYKLNVVGDKLKFEYAGLGKRDRLWIWAGDHTLNMEDAAEYDQFDTCIYAPVSLIGTNDNIGVQYLGPATSSFDDDIIDTTASKQIYYGDYSRSSDCDQIRLKVKSGSSVTQMRVRHYPSEYPDDDPVSDGLLILDDDEQFNAKTTLRVYNVGGELVHNYEYNNDLGGYYIPKTDSALKLDALGTYELYTEVTAWTVVYNEGTVQVPVGSGSVGFTLPNGTYINGMAYINKNATGDYDISVRSQRGSVVLSLKDGDTVIKSVTFTALDAGMDSPATMTMRISAGELASYVGKTVSIYYANGTNWPTLGKGGEARYFALDPAAPDTIVSLSITEDSQMGSGDRLNYGCADSELLIGQYGGVGAGSYDPKKAGLLLLLDGTPAGVYQLGSYKLTGSESNGTFHIPYADLQGSKNISFKYFNSYYTLLPSSNTTDLLVVKGLNDIKNISITNDLSYSHADVSGDKLRIECYAEDTDLNIKIDLTETTDGDSDPIHLKRTWYRSRPLESDEHYDSPYIEIDLSQIADGDTFTLSGETSSVQAANGEDYTTNYAAEIYSADGGLTYSDAAFDSANGIFSFVPDNTDVQAVLTTNISVPGDFTATSPYMVFKLSVPDDDPTTGKWYVKSFEASGNEVEYPEEEAANIAAGFTFDQEDNIGLRSLQLHFASFIPGNGTGSFDGGKIRVTVLSND